MVHMPAMNTPQFQWVKSKLPHRAQPVPPIYQPEVGARAIVWAATHKRREIHVGFPTLEAMWGEKFVPGLLDKKLGKSGYEAQQIDEPQRPDSPYNLWEPVPGQFGAHGSFDDRARGRSPEVWVAEHAGLLRSVALGGLLAVVAGAIMRRSKERKS